MGAKLDRNGLRPLRYTLTADGLVVAGSEVGIADLHDKKVIERQRLGPGEMMVVDPAKGRFLRPGSVPELGQWRAICFWCYGGANPSVERGFCRSRRTDESFGGAGME